MFLKPSTLATESGSITGQMLPLVVHFSPFPKLMSAKGSYPFRYDLSKGSEQGHVQTCFL